MTDTDVETMFAGICLVETNGAAAYPHCQCPICDDAYCPNGSLRFRYKARRKDFSLTPDTLFAFHKLPLQAHLAAIVIFCNEVKGKSTLALSRDLAAQNKTAFVLARELREAMSTEVKSYKLGGVGKTVGVDGAHFGGYVMRNNLKIGRVDRRLVRNQTGKRQCVVVIRKCDGYVMPSAFATEGAVATYLLRAMGRGSMPCGRHG